MSEEPYMHWEDVLRFLADRDAQIDRLKAENERLRQQVADLTRKLHDLTPMGSEFVHNPDRCIEWIERELSTRLAACISATAARNELEAERDKALAEASELRAGLEDAFPWVDDGGSAKLIQRIETILTVTTLAEEHLAKDRNRDEALLEIRDYSDNEGYANYQVDEMKRIARRALGLEGEQ